jgi:hypothetical protein
LATGIKRARRRTFHSRKNISELFGLGANVHVGARDLGGNRAGVERLVHDLADGASTPPALRAASEATVDLPARDRLFVRRADGGADIVVAEYVAGTDDHRKDARFPADWRNDEYDMGSGFAKEKRSLQLF